jgi:hypothetical protein
MSHKLESGFAIGRLRNRIECDGTERCILPCLPLGEGWGEGDAQGGVDLPQPSSPKPFLGTVEGMAATALTDPGAQVERE